MSHQFFNVLEKHMPLDENIKSLIESKWRVEKLRKGDFFIKSGVVSRKAGFIVSGVLRYYFVDKFGKEITTMFVKENDFVAKLNSFFDHLPSTRSVQAEVNTTMLTITYENYQDIIEQYPEYNLAIGQIATKFLTKEAKRQRLYIDHAGADRYKLFLSHFPLVNRKMALGHVASYLGMSAPTLSRIRKRMKP